MGVKLGLDITEFERNIKAADSGFRAFTKRLTLGMGAGFGLFSLAQGILSLSNAAKKLRDTASNVGLSVEIVQGWTRMARGAGAEGEQAVAALNKFAAQLGAARSGNAEAAKLFDKLGIGLEDTAGNARNTSSVLSDLLDNLRDVKDPAQRARIAMEAFGESGVKMAAGLAKGSAELKRLSSSMANLSTTDALAISKATDMLQAAKEGTVNIFSKALVGLKGVYSMMFGGPMGFAGHITDLGSTQLASDLGTEYKPAGKGLSKAQQAVLEKQQEQFKQAQFNASSTAGKIRVSEAELRKMDSKIQKMPAGSFERQQAEGEYRIKYAEYGKLVSQFKKEDADMMQKRSQAERSMSDAQTTISDRYKFSLDEVAGGRPIRGNPFVNRQIFAARRVKFLEGLAQNAAGQGNFGLAESLGDRALNLRSGIQALRSDERFPMESAYREIENSRKILDEINKKLSDLSKVTEDSE